MVNLALGAARALSNTGVTVNTISPGMIDTPSLSVWLADVGQHNGLGNARAPIEAFVLEHHVHRSVVSRSDPPVRGTPCPARPPRCRAPHWC